MLNYLIAKLMESVMIRYVSQCVQIVFFTKVMNFLIVKIPKFTHYAKFLIIR